MAADLLIAVAVVGCVVILRRTFVYPTRVLSASMTPTLAEGDLLLTRRIRPRTQLRRGDIVVLYVDELRRSVVKRLIGLPGDEVAMGSDGVVLIDGRPLEEPWSRQPGGKDGVHRVPPEHYFLLGDNRPRSNDSRSWTQPYVAREDLEGKVYLRLWPRPRNFIRRDTSGRLTATRPQRAEFKRVARLKGL